MMAVVSGRLMRNCVPFPATLETETTPPTCSNRTFDDIHSDSTARHVAHLRCRREAGSEYERDERVIVGVGIAIQQAERHGFLTNPLDVEPGAIVGYVDDHSASLVRRAKHDVSLGRFSVLGTNGRRLDSVIDGISHEVCERIS